MYKLPQLKYNSEGKIRKAGFEIEFSGIETKKAASLVRDIYGGRIESRNRYYFNLNDTDIGDFTLKIDSSFLYYQKYSEILEKLGIEDLQDVKEDNLYEQLEELFENVASGFVPYEIVTPPVPIDQLDKLDKLVNRLNKEKAEGTHSSIIYAFATHINPEAPSMNVDSILNYLRAFFLLYDWLFQELGIDFTRRLTSFINPFTKKYIRKVLDPDYSPDIQDFIKDYTEHNPQRNRPLDLYPLLSYIDPGVKEKEETGIVKPRPTYHYRLPNSEIERKEWDFSVEWNNWWYVEELASEEQTIRELSGQYLDIHDKILKDSRNKWIERTEEWIAKKNK